MNMFVTNPAKDIISSFFSTILSEVKSALLLVFKAIVKCLCVRVTFDTRYDAATFLVRNKARTIGQFKTIKETTVHFAKSVNTFTENVMIPRGLFMISGMIMYFYAREEKDKDEFYTGTDYAYEHNFRTFGYIAFWNLNKFRKVYTRHIQDLKGASTKTRDVPDNLPVNANVMNELKLIKKWAQSWSWYNERLIPFTQGIVLHGPPGSGKSTIVKTIGVITGFTIRNVSLRGTAQDFLKSMEGLGCSRPLILIEDIDTIFHGRENVCDPEKGVDFGTFINALSGVDSKEDRILVITTNKPELLDPALALIPPHGEPVPRPGRIDRVVYVGPLEPDARLKVCKRVLPDRPDLWNDLVLAGEGEVIANFQARCVRVALDLKWAELTKD